MSVRFCAPLWMVCLNGFCAIAHCIAPQIMSSGAFESIKRTIYSKARWLRLRRNLLELSRAVVALRQVRQQNLKYDVSWARGVVMYPCGGGWRVVIRMLGWAAPWLAFSRLSLGGKCGWFLDGSVCPCTSAGFAQAAALDHHTACEAGRHIEGPYADRHESHRFAGNEPAADESPLKGSERSNCHQEIAGSCAIPLHESVHQPPTAPAVCIMCWNRVAAPCLWRRLAVGATPH